jgi:ABC-type polysaccharide/polyol phosphate export permease
MLENPKEKNRETIIYDSAQRVPHALDELRQVIQYRNLIAQLTKRDILARYKRSLLGVAWTMLNPLGTMLVLTIAFSQILRFNIPGYAAFVLGGLVAWNFFAQSTTASMVNLVWGGGLLKRIYIPRSAFALAAMGTALVNLILSLAPMIVVMLIVGVPVRLSMLFLPIPCLILVLFSMGIGLLISTWAIYFPDIAEMYQIILSAWFYLNPIIYDDAMLPANLKFWFQSFNPMYNIIRLFRLPIYDGRLPTWEELLPSLLLSITVFIVGWFIFTSRSDEFAYRV